MANNSELNSLMTRVNNLEQRVRALENTVQGSSSSNYNSTKLSNEYVTVHRTVFYIKKVLNLFF